jgi:hypothetical protein
MGSASNYWRLVQLDGTGRRRIEEVANARAFFQERLAATQPLSDLLTQQELLQMRQDSSASLADRQSADGCLRCFISHQIEWACVRLEIQFGTRQGFTRNDLFPFVLDDDLRVDRPFSKGCVST